MICLSERSLLSQQRAVQRSALPTCRGVPTCSDDLLDNWQQGRVPPGYQAQSSSRCVCFSSSSVACMSHVPSCRQQVMMLRHHVTCRSSWCVHSFLRLPACIHNVLSCWQ